MGDEIDDAALDAGRKANIEARDSEVDRALAMSNFAGALSKALENPPLGTKDPEIKVRQPTTPEESYRRCQRMAGRYNPHCLCKRLSCCVSPGDHRLWSSECPELDLTLLVPHSSLLGLCRSRLPVFFLLLAIPRP